MVNVNARAVLLLDASYVPLRSITVRDAVHLMMRGVVDAVDGVAARLRTPGTVFEVPSVLRLRVYVNVPQRGLCEDERRPGDRGEPRAGGPGGGTDDAAAAGLFMG